MSDDIQDVEEPAKVKELRELLKQEVDREGELLNKKMMARRIRHLYDHHVHAKRFEEWVVELRDLGPNWLQWATAVLLVALLFATVVKDDTPSGLPGASSTDDLEVTKTSASNNVDRAKSCLVWCSSRDLLVVRVVRDGCECIDEDGLPTEMTWSHYPDKFKAFNMKVDMDACAGKKTEEGPGVY